MNWFVVKPFKMDLDDQSADFKISPIVIPVFEAVEDEVPRTEWVEKICVVIPASPKSLFNHLAMVLDVTALCGLINSGYE